MPFYSFDTSAFINGRRDLFRPNTFGALWDAIDSMIENGIVRAVDEVKIEVAKKDDEVAKWVRDRRGLFVSLDHDSGPPTTGRWSSDKTFSPASQPPRRAVIPDTTTGAAPLHP